MIVMSVSSCLYAHSRGLGSAKWILGSAVVGALVSLAMRESNFASVSKCQSLETRHAIVQTHLLKEMGS